MTTYKTEATIVNFTNIITLKFFDNTLKNIMGRDRTWSLQTSGLYFEVSLFYLINEGVLKCVLYLQVGLYM